MLARGEEKDVFAGHLWIYDNEVQRVEGSPEPGGIVDVLASNGVFLGRGYYNPRSKILVRLLTRGREEIDSAFLEKRLRTALEYREKLGLAQGERPAYRAVFGEADFLPALIVDRYADCLAVQTLALGIDQYKAEIVRILAKLLQPRCIYERNDVPLREKEGLPQQKGVLFGENPGTVEILENGVRMLVDIENGQKTGYFLDQRENRAAIAPYVRGAHVLDCFCHTGGFALHAAKYGAAQVEAVDISETALEEVRRNAQLNGFSQVTAVKANVFDLLTACEREGRMFDVIVLDPPAFCKTKAALAGAYRGYKEINLRAMKLVRPGGFLVTCSCSHFMSPELFLKMLQDAALDARRACRIAEQRYQAKDHPVALGAEESLYLKYVALQVQ